MAHYGIDRESLVPLRPLKWLAIESFKLGYSTVDAAIVARTLYVNFILIVICAQKAWVKYLKCISESLACRVMTFCTCFCQIVRQLEVFRGIQSQVEDSLWCSLTVPRHLDQEFKLENALIQIVFVWERMAVSLYEKVVTVDERVLVIIILEKLGRCLAMAQCGNETKCTSK